jgi:hypothetical protein
LRKIFPGILLEKSAKITRRLLPSAAPAVPLSSPPHFTVLGDITAQMTRRDVIMLCNFTLRLRHGREIAQPYPLLGTTGYPASQRMKYHQKHITLL